jgi:hypothetical protein
MSGAAVSAEIVSDDARGYRLTVRVREGRGETTHEVTIARDLLTRLAPGESAEAFTQRCFAFLLEREAKESILRSFDVSLISRYFPEFEREIARH